MANYVIHAKTGHYNITGASFMSYGKRYREAAEVWSKSSDLQGKFDPILYQLLCQSLELHLKSFIWLKEKKSSTQIKSKYGHNIIKLWTHAKVRGINNYARITPLRDAVITLVGPYYKEKKFCYLDIEMVFGGFSNLNAQPRAINTLFRLTQQLETSLRTPILRAS